MIDLRSDTVTRPTRAMRKAMADAEVGDDVYREDPTVRKLEELGAELLGREAALFLPTGTMGNEVAINLHTSPGDEVILDHRSHIMNYELGAMAAFSGVMPRPVSGERGFPAVDQVREAVRPSHYLYCRTRLLALENTHNLAGGGVFPQEKYDAVVAFAHRAGLKVHLDGARLFNAAAATGASAKQLAGEADSIMISLSKGLAAPAGSLLAGEKGFIEEAVQVRKRMGGGMRQVGILAGAGLVALNTMRLRLTEDHHHAKLLATRLAETPGVEIDPEEVETNIVIFRVQSGPASKVTQRLEGEGVLCLDISKDQIRMVTHLDVSRSQVLSAAESIRKIVGS